MFGIDLVAIGIIAAAVVGIWETFIRPAGF